ncbi:MAG: hypothetical protein KF729_02000 [Sandaracinaceae bacterium]|nr:hypothetical protein [Sandaracinaceae bacterium]
MIVLDDKKSWLRTLYAWKGTALQRSWKRVAFTTTSSMVITYVDLGQGGRWTFHEDLTIVPFSLVAVALGIFLGFRNNTSYDRFWEGRKLWGAMVNTTRSVTRQILTLIGPIQKKFEGKLTDGIRSYYYGELPTAAERLDDPELEEILQFHREMVYRVAAYAHAVRLHLRDQRDLTELRRLLPDDEVDQLLDERNPPNAILQTLGDRFREAWLRGWIHSHHLVVLEGSLTDFSNIQGGCERIKNTPIPFSYSVLTHRIVALYCTALPFGIVNQTEWFTPLVVAIISYAFFGLDAVGSEIDDPFGTDPNDLPLLSITTMIEGNLRQRIGDEDLPAPIQPVDGVLQ